MNPPGAENVSHCIHSTVDGVQGTPEAGDAVEKLDEALERVQREEERGASKQGTSLKGSWREPARGPDTWLQAEKALLEGKISKTSKGARVKLYCRRAFLRRTVKGLRFSVPQIRVAIEKFRYIAKVKENQLKRKRTWWKRQELTAAAQKKGLGVVVRTEECAVVCFRDEEVERLGEFWRRVWQCRGKYNPHHQVIAERSRASWKDARTT